MLPELGWDALVETLFLNQQHFFLCRSFSTRSKTHPSKQGSCPLIQALKGIRFHLTMNLSGFRHPA